MDIIIFSDLHIHNYQKYAEYSESRLQHTLQVLLDLFDYAKTNGISNIIFCGDLYDRQKNLPTVVVNETIKTFDFLFKKYPHIYFYALTGNHDLATRTFNYKEYISAIQHLDTVFENFICFDFKRVQVKQDFEFVEIYGIPYLMDEESFSLALDNAPQTNLLIIHNTPNEFMEGEFSVFDGRFENYDYVFCGHIHEYRKYNSKFSTVGNPLHRDLSDINKEKLFLIYNSESKEYKKISNKNKYPEFMYGEELNDGNFYISEKEKKSISINNEIVELEENIPIEKLIENYLQSINITDTELLNIGIKCVKYI